MSEYSELVKQKQCNFRCPAWLRAAVSEAATELGISDSAYIKLALSTHLSDHFDITEPDVLANR